MRDDTIYFHLPGFAKELEILTTLVMRMGQHPDHYYDNIAIGSFFGCPPGALWNGGRYIPESISREDTVKMIKIINDFHIPLRYTWTNPVLEEEDLQDDYCNFVMRASDNGLNQVLVGTDLMENYIRENYPNFPIISSTTKRITDPDVLKNEIDKDYKLVVLDYDFNNHWDILKKIKHPEKVEILLNATCNPNCPFRKKHYEIMGKMQKGDFSEVESDIMSCVAQKRKYHEKFDLPAFVTREDLYGKYYKMGFRNFKIEGRGEDIPIKIIYWILYYMVKPEFQDEERGCLEVGLK